MENQGFPEDTDTYSIQDYIGEDTPGFFYILKLDPSSQQMGEPGLLQTSQEGGEELEGRE